MKRWILICSVFLLSVGCGERAEPSEPWSPSNETQVVPIDNSLPETLSSLPEEEDTGYKWKMRDID